MQHKYTYMLMHKPHNRFAIRLYTFHKRRMCLDYNNPSLGRINIGTVGKYITQQLTVYIIMAVEGERFDV